MSSQFKHPIVKIPSETELVLFLIREELKNSKLFSGLHIAGLEDCPYQSYFGSVVMAYVGLDDGSDEITEFYTKLVDKYTESIEPDNDTIMKCAFDLYTELIVEKKKRNANQ
jgi:hypothetical protein